MCSHFFLSQYSSYFFVTDEELKKFKPSAILAFFLNIFLQRKICAEGEWMHDFSICKSETCNSRQMSSWMEATKGSEIKFSFSNLETSSVIFYDIAISYFGGLSSYVSFFFFFNSELAGLFFISKKRLCFL